MKKSLGLALMAAMFVVPAAQAGVFVIPGATITQTLSADQGRFGGCMAKLNAPVVSFAPGALCPDHWITFDCANTLTSSDPRSSSQMFDQVQLAYALRDPVTIIINDAEKVNGFCYGNRVDIGPRSAP